MAQSAADRFLMESKIGAAGGVARSDAAGVSAKAYGAKADGSDDAPALAAALSAASAAGVDLMIPPGTYKCNSGISWDGTLHSVRGLGDVTLDFSGMASGYAVSGTGGLARGGTFSHRNATHVFEGIRIVGPTADATTTDGIYLNDSSGLDQVTFANVYVTGFRDQVVFDTNNWCVGFNKCVFGNAKRRALNFDATTNAGENYHFFGCTFYGAANVAGDAVEVYTSPTGNPDAHFFGCSFDYSNIEVSHNSGNLTFVGCHFENKTVTQPMVKLSQTGGQAHTTLSVLGGGFGPTEDVTTSRDHLIEVVAGSTGSVYVTSSGVGYGLYDRATRVFVDKVGGATFRHIGGHLDNSGGGTRAGDFGHTTNMLADGAFETLALGSNPGWANGGTATYSLSTENPRSGTKSLKAVGPGGTYSSSVFQYFPVTPGTRLLISAWIALQGVTAGTAQLRYAWYLNDKTTRVTITNVGALLSANQPYTPTALQVTVPPGVSFGYVDIQLGNFAGTAYIDDFIVSAL